MKLFRKISLVADRDVFIKHSLARSIVTNFYLIGRACRYGFTAPFRSSASATCLHIVKLQGLSPCIYDLKNIKYRLALGDHSEIMLNFFYLQSICFQGFGLCTRYPCNANEENNSG